MSGAAIMIIVLLIGLRPVARCRFSATWIREQRAPITAELRTEVENARWQQRVGGIAGSIVATLFWRNAVRGERLCEVCSAGESRLADHRPDHDRPSPHSRSE